MDSVVFDGKEYTKASVVAEKFRYTQDYLGQLCRGKKVDARLVGRAWYVNIDSLTSHKDSRYKPTAAVKTAEISPKKPSNHYLSRIDVEPILKKKTIKIFKAENGALSEVPVTYEADDHALIPRINKEAVSVELPIDPVGAEAVRVKKVGSEKSTFAPEELPEVYLRGTLSVSGIPEPTEAAIPEEVPQPIKVSIVREATEQRSIPSDTPHASVKTVVTQPQIKPKTITVRPRIQTNVPASQPAPPSKATSSPRPTMASADPTPVQKTVPVETKKSSVAATPPRFTPTLVVKKVEETVPPPSLFIRAVVPVSILVIAFICSGFVLVTTAEVLATSSSYNDRLVIQAANLLALYDFFIK